MNNKIFCASSSLLIFILTVGLFLPIEELYAGNNPDKKIQHWDAGISISPFYDSNILKYSDKYIDRFINRQDEGRFQINRYDDIVSKYSADLSYSNDFIKKLKTTFSFDINYFKYSFNPIKNWLSYSIGLRQYFYEKSSFMISYSYIPHFYVRHFRDEDWITVYGYTPITFQPYEFSKDDFSLWAEHYFFKDTRVRLYLSYMKYFLDPNNTEYDSKDYLVGIRVYHQLTDKLKINAGYKYVYSDAKGYDQPGETKQSSDDVNATNYGHNFLAGINYDLPKVFGIDNSIGLDAVYERGFYTTNQFYELDPIHAGRNDKNYDITITYGFDFSANLEMSAFYSLLGRKTGTPVAANAEYISDEKSYEQYQTGIQINYNFKF